VPSYHLGLAQLEEIQDALLELRKAKEERLGKGNWRTVAWTDSFTSQGQYLFATGQSVPSAAICVDADFFVLSFR
jgi:hypothetical protein